MGLIFNFTEVIERWLFYIVFIVILLWLSVSWGWGGGEGFIILDDVEWYIDESDIS